MIFSNFEWVVRPVWKKDHRYYLSHRFFKDLEGFRKKSPNVHRRSLRLVVDKVFCSMPAPSSSSAWMRYTTSFFSSFFTRAPYTSSRKENGGRKVLKKQEKSILVIIMHIHLCMFLKLSSNKSGFNEFKDFFFHLIFEL